MKGRKYCIFGIAYPHAKQGSMLASSAPCGAFPNNRAIYFLVIPPYHFEYIKGDKAYTKNNVVLLA
jgi:hypothetical protein